MPRRLLSFVVAMVAACTPPRSVEVQLPPIDGTRLRHEQHTAVPCVGCHRGDARPGADDHAPCNQACHEDKFLQPPTPFCQVCHTKITPQPLTAPLKPYPLGDAWRTQPSRFSHARHLDARAMEGHVGFHIACADCHERDGKKVPPDHATCARCHAPEAALPATAPRMTDCKGCHLGGAHERTRARLITDDLHFDHERHKTDRRGRTIPCQTCHAQTAKAQSYEAHDPPRISACVTCHDDSDRTPDEMRMRVCETCHSARSMSLTTLAPRNHLPATERPIDHTLAFRRDHAEVASRDSTRCATCHTRMSGNPRQACDECHQTMQPADHRITWRELDHGPEAAADRERCARCHVVEFCTACHAQRPRSHGMGFISEHGRLARINVRPCAACHGERFCMECHEGLARGLR